MEEGRLRAIVERDLRFTIDRQRPATPKYKLGKPDGATLTVQGGDRFVGTLARLYGCPGHVASDFNPRICRYCGTHSEGA